MTARTGAGLTLRARLSGLCNQQAVLGFCAKAIGADLAGAAVAAAGWRYAKRRGGVTFERVRLAFRCAAAASLAGSLATVAVAKVSYDGVRGLQQRRLEMWEAGRSSDNKAAKQARHLLGVADGILEIAEKGA